MELALYYDLVKDLSYTVNYLEQGTNEVLREAKIVNGQKYGATVTEQAVDISGYEKVEPTSEIITIAVKDNEINFYYKKASYTYIIEYYIDGELSLRELADAETGMPVPSSGTGLFGSSVSPIFPNEVKPVASEPLVEPSSQYALDYVDSVPLTISNDTTQNVIKVYYAEDKTGPETPGRPDGIPDKYQATVTYQIVNGTFGQGGTTSVTEVITVAQKDENGNVTPVDYKMNVPVNMVPAVGYDQQPGTWGNADFNTKLEGGSTYTFTYVYGINNYSVNVSVANGTSNVDTVGTTGTYGSDLTYAFAPADGYALDSVTVDVSPLC